MEINTQSINLVATANDGGKQVLLIGLKEAYRDKPQYQRYLKKEFERAKSLDNPNIFKLLAIKENPGNGTCIETEWEDARTLAEWLKEDHNDDEKKRVVRQIASAVGYMHGQGVVQGNLNTHNVFITKRGDQARLLAVRLRYTDILRQPAETLKFLAPEAKDGTVGLDGKADIYSLGIMLREMGFTAEYASVIDKCCRFGRNERFEDTDAFLDAFERHRYTRTASAADDMASAGNSSNKKMAITVAAIVVLIIAAVALLAARGGNDDESATAPATEQADSDSTVSDMDSTEKQQPATAVPSDSTGAAYSGGNAFLGDLVPQMHADLDKIFNDSDQTAVHRKVSTYYKGLRRVLKRRGLTSSQLDAFDQAFAEYVKSKK